MADPSFYAAELYYWVLEQHRRRGLALEGARLLCRWALAGRIKVITAIVSDRNTASRSLLRRLGFNRGGQTNTYAGYADCADSYSYFLLELPKD